MASIDNRIVEMKFDNAAFERKIATTIQSLDKLNDSLTLKDSTKGFGDISTAAQNVNLGPVAGAIDGVTAKFNALSIVGVTVLATIVKKATDAGIALGKSLSLDQVISGFREYETNMKSIQTILANTRQDGTNLQDVNAALDELNSYADLTIYNFAQMTRNIGTFTAAGVNLDTSVQSIKGIANLAAISGSTSQQASTAMYQLSQAISSGSLKLMDWNSVVNAGMGGRVFQEALFRTGQAMGTITGAGVDTTFQEWTDAGNTFRNSLQDGWITADVLTTTLQGFTGEMTEAQLATIGYSETQIAAILEMGETGVEAATKVRTLTQLIDTAQEAVGSGWSQSFRIILGDFESATVLFSRISDSFGEMVGRSADARNALLQDFVDEGGRDNLIDALFASFEAVGTIITTIKESFRDIFPAKSGADLAYAAAVIKDFVEGLVLTTDQIEIAKELFKGFFSVLDIVGTVLQEVVGLGLALFREVLGQFDGGTILDFFLDLSTRLQNMQENLWQVSMVFDAVRGYLIAFINDPIGSLERLVEQVKEAYTVLTTGYENMGNLPSGLVDFLTMLNEELLEFPRDIWSILVNGDFQGLLGMNEDHPFILFLFRIREEILALPDEIPFIGRLEQGFERLTGFAESVADIFSPLTNILGEVMRGIGGWFGELADKMAAEAEPGDFSKVLDAVNLGLVGAIGGMLAYLVGGIDLDFGGVLEGLGETLEGFGDILQAMAVDIKAGALVKIAAAVGILAASALVLASIDSASLTKAMTAIAIGLSQLMIGFLAVTKMGGIKGAVSFTVAATGLVALSGALLILSIAMKVLASMSWEEMSKGIVAITALLGALSAATFALSANSAGMIRSGIGLIAIATALNLLAAAMKIFGTMEWEEMAKGLTGVVGGLVGIGAAMQLFPNNMPAKGAGLVLVAMALNMLAGAVALFATMSWKRMGKGLAGVVGSLIGIGIAMQLMPAHLPIIGAGLLLVAGALMVISEAVMRMGDLEWEELAKGVGGIAAVLLTLSVAALAMSNPMVLVGATAITIMSGALLMMAAALRIIGGLGIQGLIIGLAGIAGVLITFGVAAALMTPVIPTLLALGVALAALGVGIALIGAGAALLATAFSIIANAGIHGIEVLMSLIDNILERVPELAEGLAVGILEIADIILEAMPVIIEQLGVILGHMVDTVIELIPKFIELMKELIDAALEVITDKAPDIIEAGFQLLLDFLKGIRDNIGELIDVAADIIVEFLAGIADNMSDIIDAGADLLIEFIKGIADNIGDVLSAGTDVIVEFISGLGSMGVELIDAGVNAMLDFAQGIADGTITLIDGAADIIIDFINALADTIDEKAPELRDAGLNLAGSLIDGMTFGLAGKAKDAVGGIVDVGGDMVSGIGSFFGINSPSKVFMGIGESLVEGLALGVSHDDDAKNSAKNLAKNTQESFQDSLDVLAKSLSFSDDFQPTITPVLDLSMVEKDAMGIGSILGGASVASPVRTYNQANAIASTELEQDSGFTASGGVTEVKFEQNNYSPESLSTADIYRQTRNQITIAKEELDIS